MSMRMRYCCKKIHHRKKIHLIAYASPDCVPVRRTVIHIIRCVVRSSVFVLADTSVSHPNNYSFLISKIIISDQSIPKTLYLILKTKSASNASVNLPVNLLNCTAEELLSIQKKQLRIMSHRIVCTSTSPGYLY